MNIVPVGYRNLPVTHFTLGNLATIGSASYAALATGMAYMPIGAWACGSAVGSFVYYNGTSGSALFHLKTGAGGVNWIDFWEDPSAISAAKCPVLESSTTGIGVSNFHVFAIAVRAGAGNGGTTQ